MLILALYPNLLNVSIMNKDILLDEINQFIDSISHFRDSLEQEDTQEMKRLFIQSTKRRDKFNKTDAKKR